jgi:nucleoside-diphosphate-sugar epimerase
MGRHAFIIGGTGQISSAIADNLLAHGWDVTVSHRGRRSISGMLMARGARHVTMDREVPDALARALRSGADAVIDTIAYTASHADQLLGIQSAADAFVLISSASVYQDAAGRTLDEAQANGFPELPEPIKETQPTVAPGPQTYSTRKIALEQRLLDHSRKPVTILRPCAIHGPHSIHPREWWFVKRMLDGRKTIPLAYRGESRFHTSATVNIAALVRAVLERPETRILNAADPSAPTVAEIGRAIAKYLGYDCAFLPVDDDSYPPIMGVSPWAVPRPFIVDMSAASALGYVPVGAYEETAGHTCEWLKRVAPANWREKFPMLASYGWDLFDYPAEDAFLERQAKR